MKKKIIAFAVVIAMLAIAIVGGTLAYFTDTYNETNTIIIGDVEAKLYESRYHRGSATGYLSITDQPNPTKDEHIMADAENYQDYLAKARLMPFDLSHQDNVLFQECTIAKNAYVKNTGVDNDCFVRVSYLIPADMAQYLDIFYVNSQFITKADDVATANARDLDNTDKTEPMIVADGFNFAGANFVKQVGENARVTVDSKEYYVASFIYAERLTPGEMTLYSPVSKITMVPSVTAEIVESIADRKFDILVQADVIQADGFVNALEAFNTFAFEYQGN